jgi:protein-tyrosine phosphatase
LLGRGQERPELSLPEGGEVLFICRGNRCRSPMAEVLAAEVARELGLTDLRFNSAGLEVVIANPVSQGALAAVEELGFSLGGHVSRQVTAHMARTCGLIVVMEEWQAQALRERFPEAAGKLVLLPQFATRPQRGRARFNIADPYGRDIEVYRACRDAIRDCLAGLLSHIADGRRKNGHT